MGATNNSLVKIKDIRDSGGIMTKNNFSIDENKLLKDIEITSRQQQETGQIHLGPLCYNVTLKNKYGNDHLTKFQDLDIAKTYPITLEVSIPNGMTGYTLHGFTAKVTYPNSSVKSHSIDITETTSDTNIVLENCCDNAKVKVSVSAENSGATMTMSGSNLRFNANVSISPIFSRGNGLICTGASGYSCFTLTDTLNPGGPVITGNIGTYREIVISINTTNLSSDKLFIEKAKYATGTTLTEVQNNSNLIWTTISGLTASSAAAVEATISVPAKSCVAIYLTDPVDKSSVTPTTYKWKEGNYQYIKSSPLPETVTYTVIPSYS